MTDARNLVLLGLPRTGKSTYLGTLWHMVEEPDVTEVEMSDLPADRTHVRRLANAVRGLEEMPRTRSEDHEEFNVPVRFADAKEADLRIPDLSGEYLQAIVERRTMSPELRQELDEASGLLLFVHPNRTTLPTGLAVVGAPDAEDESATTDGEEALAAAGAEGAAATTHGEEALAAAGAEGAAATTDGEEAPAPASADDPIPLQGEAALTFENKSACTAAQLVDCLENTLEAMSDRWPVRVVIAVSAFDLTMNRTPEEWLQDRLPALKSFLELNQDRLEWTVFGVSAQGGPRRDKETLLDSDLHERAYARDRQGTKVGFSDPVRWALGWH